MRFFAMSLVAVIGSSWVVASVLAYFFQERLIFLPERLPASHRFDFPEPFEERRYQTAPGVSLSALLFQATPPPRARSAKGIVLYFHGNAGSLASWGYVASDFTRLGYDILLVDYRGYGTSSGTIEGEHALHQDAEHIYQQLEQEYWAGNIVVYGRSIGTGVAAQLAATRREGHQPRLLILESPYTSLSALAAEHFWFLPTGLLLRYPLATDKALASVPCPIVLIHGEDDRLIPPGHSVALKDLALKAAAQTDGAPEVSRHLIPAGGHNNLSDFQSFHEALAQALAAP